MSRNKERRHEKRTLGFKRGATEWQSISIKNAAAVHYKHYIALAANCVLPPAHFCTQTWITVHLITRQIKPNRSLLWVYNSRSTSCCLAATGLIICSSKKRANTTILSSTSFQRLSKWQQVSCDRWKCFTRNHWKHWKNLQGRWKEHEPHVSKS